MSVSLSSLKQNKENKKKKIYYSAFANGGGGGGGGVCVCVWGGGVTYIYVYRDVRQIWGGVFDSNYKYRCGILAKKKIYIYI